MKYLNKTNKLIVAITSLVSLLIYYPIGIFISKAVWAKSMLSFDSVDPSHTDKILSFSANEASFIIPLILIMIIIICCGFIGAYFIVKGKSKFERIWGWMTAIAGGFGIAFIFALVSFLIGKEDKNKRVPKPRGFKKVSGLRTATLIATPFIAIAPILAIGFDNAGTDVATTVDGIKLAANHKIKLDSKGKPVLDKDKKLTLVKSNLNNIIEISVSGLDSHMAMPSLEVDSTLKDFKLFDHFVSPGAETSYSLPLELGDFKKYNKFITRYVNEDSELTNFERNKTDGIEALRDDLEVTAKIAGGKSYKAKYPNNYLINPASLSGDTIQKSVSGDTDFIKNKFPGVNVVNWAQAKEDLSGTFGISKYSPDNSFFGWFNQESKATAKANTHVYLRTEMTNVPRNTSRGGSTSYWSGKNWLGQDLSLYNATHAEIDSLDETIKHLKSIDAYDNSLILIYGDHANNRTLIPHPGDGNVNGDMFHSVAMIKYPGQVAAATKEEPDLTHIGFYGGDINQVITSFKNNSYDTFNSMFVRDSKGIFGDQDFPTSKEYAGFYKSSLALLKFNAKGELKLDTTKGRTTNNDGWITYEEFAAKARSHRRSGDSYKNASDKIKKMYRQSEATQAVRDLFGMVK